VISAFWQRFKIVLTVCGVLSLVHIVNMALGGQLNQFGILPRDISSLPYIYSSPLLHGNLSHLVNNLIGLSLFSWLCLIRSVRLYVWSSLFIVTLTGILVWFFGRQAIHIGASGWIFGLWSLSIALAWFDRRPLNILIALIVVFLYGGMIYGVLPQGSSISFEAHFFGAVSGVLAAWLSTLKVFKKKLIKRV
jgi:membrane associated rhomboid family serine protease